MEKEDFYGKIYGNGEENPTNKGGKIPDYAKSTVPEESNQQGEKKEPHGNAWDSTSKGKESADFKPKTEEDLAKERKSRKLELIAGAIGDGISSLSNLFFASKGAPSIINTSGKKTVPSLMDSIRSKHKEQDSKYNDALTAWQKEQEKKEREFEKKKKEAEKIAKENELAEIHEKFSPKAKNWDDEGYIDWIFDKFQKEIENKTTKYNNSGEDVYFQDGLSPKSSTFAGTIKNGQPYPNNSEVIKYINSFDLKGKAKKYFKQDIMSTILSGENTFGLDDDFIEELRILMREEDESFVK